MARGKSYGLKYNYSALNQADQRDVSPSVTLLDREEDL
jgi:hypothetical protein